MSSSKSNVTIELYQDRHFADVVRMRRTFLNSKHVLCCIPSGTDSASEVRKEYRKCPAKKTVAAVATVPDKGVVGYCQCLLEGMPCDIHKVKPGECYVYMLTVDPDARGMGVGSALMKWAEDLGREKGCTHMKLGVIRGNPAIGLYERKGYVIQPQPLWKRMLLTIPMCLFIGPVICTKGSPSYCSYGQVYDMKKPLE